MTTRTITLAMAGMLAMAPAWAQSSLAQTVPASISAGKLNAMVERRISELHNRLKITAEEQPAFDSFAAVMRDNAAHMEGVLQDRHKALTGMTAVEQLKAYQMVTRAHADDLDKLVPAFESLYGTLSPDQKKQADVSFREFAKTAGRART